MRFFKRLLPWIASSTSVSEMPCRNAAEYPEQSQVDPLVHLLVPLSEESQELDWISYGISPRALSIRASNPRQSERSFLCELPKGCLPPMEIKAGSVGSSSTTNRNSMKNNNWRPPANALQASRVHRTDYCSSPNVDVSIWLTCSLWANQQPFQQNYLWSRLAYFIAVTIPR